MRDFVAVTDPNGKETLLNLDNVVAIKSVTAGRTQVIPSGGQGFEVKEEPRAIVNLKPLKL